MKVNTNKTEAIVIFCQAPADIPMFLTLYKKYNGKRNIYAYIINVFNVWKFISELNLNLQSLIFIPYGQPSIRQPWTLIREKRRIRDLKVQHFDVFEDSRIFFFSRFEDWLTAAFIISLEKRNQICYVANYDDIPGDFNKRRKLNFKRLLFRSIHWYLTGICFRMQIIEKLPEFPVEEYNIKKIVIVIDRTVYDEYSFKFEKKFSKKPIALLFLVPFQSAIYCKKDYDRVHFELIQLLSDSGYYIMVKGHPRLGVPQHISELVDMEISSHIPAEFIRSNEISICFGINTTAIAAVAKETSIPTFSLINLFDFAQPDLANQYKEFLVDFSDNKIRFIANIEHFKEQIKGYGRN